jgi:hypothetical protein
MIAFQRNGSQVLEKDILRHKTTSLMPVKDSHLIGAEADFMIASFLK